jgi:hypothetical protein
VSGQLHAPTALPAGEKAFGTSCENYYSSGCTMHCLQLSDAINDEVFKKSAVPIVHQLRHYQL